MSKDLRRRLDNTTCGEEIFFQTILLNSSFKNNIVNNHLRYMDWNAPTGTLPKILSADDFEKIYKKDFLFCRKVDSTISKALMDEIDQRILMLKL